MKNKLYHLTVNHQPFTLTFIPPHQRDICLKCQCKKEISVISENSNPWTFSTKKRFCWSCAWTNLYELEEEGVQIKNKKEVIKEIRDILRGRKPPTAPEELLECYE